MGYRLEVKGADWGALGEAKRRRIGQVVSDTTQAVADDARRIVPVDTGALRDSIQETMTGPLEGVVDVGAEYASYVEMGTRFAAAQPYLDPAVELNRPRFEAAIAAALSAVDS